MTKRHLSRAAAFGLGCAVAGCALFRAPASSPARATMTPRNGLEVIGAIRYAHPSRALRSLAFTMTIRDRGNARRTTRARALAALPGKFRVALLPSSVRSGYVRNRQQLAVFERGERVATASRVDLATILAYDLFAQSIDTTIIWLDSARVRFGLLRRDELDGQPVWVVGASEGDTTSAQFWVDADRWQVLRVIQRDPRSPRDIIDIRFTAFTDVLDVPVPMASVTYRNGRLAETREFSNLAANPSLPRSAFDLTRWRDVR
jgi:hypothetical protein